MPQYTYKEVATTDTKYIAPDVVEYDRTLCIVAGRLEIGRIRIREMTIRELAELQKILTASNEIEEVK